MAMRFLAPLLLALFVAGCSVLPPADQPASPNRMGRFLGLVASCGCSDITPARMISDYPRALGDRYSAEEIKAMRAYVQLGAAEHAVNQSSICGDVCTARCMVNSVAAPLGGSVSPGIASCLVNERDLHMEEPKVGTGL